MGPIWGFLAEKTNKTKRKEKEERDFFINFCLGRRAMVFKRMWQTSVHLWGVLTLLCICWDFSEGEIMQEPPSTAFACSIYPPSSTPWLPFGCGSNREPTCRSSVQIQGNPVSPSGLWIGGVPFGTSQSPGSLARRFLTGTRGSVTRKHFPALPAPEVNGFPPPPPTSRLHCGAHSPIYKPLWAISSTVDKPGNITEAAPPSVIYVPC